METAYAITARPRKGRVSLIRGINSDAQDGQDGGTSSFLRRQEPRSPFPFVVSLSNHVCHAPIGNRPRRGTIAQPGGRPVTYSDDNAGFDALVSAIESLQERIHRDGDTIGSNEIRTRTALVDPILTALGWDTTNPAMVIPEYAAGGGTADYALLKVTPDGGTPVIAFVEAKRLHEPLESHRAQMLTYANMAGVKYAGLTNGDRWELYEVFKEAPLHERRIVDVSLRRERAFDCAVKLLRLRWPSLETGRALSDVVQPLLLDALNRKASPAVVAMLLDKGANANVQLRDGRTLLHWAVRNTKTETIAALIDHGADIDAIDDEGSTALHHAVKLSPNPTEVITLLLRRGASIEVQNHNGMTPLYYAVLYNPKVIALLLDWGSDTEAAMSIGWRPLHCAASKSNTEAIALLLDRGADIDGTDDEGSVPLHWASGSTNANPQSVELLLDSGASIDATDGYGRTPLHYAASKSNPDVVAFLLDQGADIRAKDDKGWTPLHNACTGEQDPSVVSILLNGGAEVEATTNDGWTPLHASVRYGTPDCHALRRKASIVKTLIDHGANLRALTNDGQMPYQVAKDHGASDEILQLLRKL